MKEKEKTFKVKILKAETMKDNSGKILKEAISYSVERDKMNFYGTIYLDGKEAKEPLKKVKTIIKEKINSEIERLKLIEISEKYNEEYEEKIKEK